MAPLSTQRSFRMTAQTSYTVENRRLLQDRGILSRFFDTAATVRRQVGGAAGPSALMSPALSQLCRKFVIKSPYPEEAFCFQLFYSGCLSIRSYAILFFLTITVSNAAAPLKYNLRHCRSSRSKTFMLCVLNEPRFLLFSGLFGIFLRPTSYKNGNDGQMH